MPAIEVTQDDGSCTESSHDTCIKDALNRVGRQTANQVRSGRMHGICVSYAHPFVEHAQIPYDALRIGFLSCLFGYSDLDFNPSCKSHT